MQNLKDIGKRKEANMILALSILITVITIFIVNLTGKSSSSMAFLCNIAGGALLTEYFYKKYFPDDLGCEKKKIWKPLVISVIILIPFVVALIYNLNHPN